jgi:hypothetical protein
LAAPAGFDYYALGNNLLSEQPKPPAIGSGYYIYNGKFHIGGKSFPLYRSTDSPEKNDTELSEYHRAMQAISWYRVRKGSTLQ